MFQFAFFFMAGLLGSPSMASSASEHLQQMDGKANAPSDTWFRFNAVTQDPGKAP